MPFRGDDPLGTPGGQDVPELPQDTADIRIAIGGSYIAYLLVNGPVSVRQRSSIESVVRTLTAKGLRIVTIILRENGAVVDNDTGDINASTGIRAVSVSPGVVTLEIPTAGITTAMLTDALVTAAKIAAGAVGTAALADGAVTSLKILDGNVTAAKIAAGVIPGPELVADSVNASHIIAGAVGTTEMALNSISTSTIIDGAITNAKLASPSVSFSNYYDGSIGTSKIADGNITNAKILDGAVNSLKLGTNSVQNAKIAAGAVTTDKIADNAVTPAKLSIATVVGHNALTLGINVTANTGNYGLFYLNCVAGQLYRVTLIAWTEAFGSGTSSKMTPNGVIQGMRVAGIVQDFGTTRQKAMIVATHETVPSALDGKLGIEIQFDWVSGNTRIGAAAIMATATPI